VSLDAGRLDFEDDRRWWWDEELDAVRAAFETETFEISAALARELAPSRSDRSFVDPDHDRVLRVLGEISGEWREAHALELFLVHHDDRAPDVRPGAVLSREREDESNARLLWLGARAMGVAQLDRRGLLGYWVDLGFVRGRERFVEFEELSSRRSVAEEVLRRDVSGWGLDLGLSWILPLRLEPRLFGSYAMGSGDPDPEAGADRSFRQTDLEANEAGFGGVERFPHYGLLLDPELSNLQVFTLGGGLSLLRSSSLDLVYHHYRLGELATSLRDARLELTLDGRHRHLGDELDLVLAVEEWERVEFDVALAVFRAGSALGRERAVLSYGGFFAFRVAF
jgi:alginate production protein